MDGASTSRFRATACALVALAALCLAFVPAAVSRWHEDRDDARGPLDLRGAGIHQRRMSLKLTARTAGEWRPGQLDPTPEVGGDRAPYLCLELLQDKVRDRWCVARRARKTHLFGGRVNEAGQTPNPEPLAGTRIRRSGHRLKVGFRFSGAGLGIGGYRWRMFSGWGDPSCSPLLPLPGQKPCTDRAPNRGRYKARVIRPRMVGCTRDERMFNTHGSTRGKRMALTFDDGPSAYTGQVLSILNDHHVRSTFFEIGQEIPGHGPVMRRIIRSGSELANHSLHHEEGASAASLRETNARIKAATGFRPCLFRPPDGLVSASTSRAAWSLGMSNILWDVDPRDWSNPGSGAIYSRVVGAAHPGAIVVMHDGGGNRSQTVAALPKIISTLKGRGYRLVTVTQLLNERFRWRP